jgi:hypothetical protein
MTTPAIRMSRVFPVRDGVGAGDAGRGGAERAAGAGDDRAGARRGVFMAFSQCCLAGQPKETIVKF